MGVTNFSASTEQAREAARHSDGRFGAYTAAESGAELKQTGPQADTRALGAQVQLRAEKLAGITAEELVVNWQSRCSLAEQQLHEADPAPEAPHPEDLSDEHRIWVFQRRMLIHNSEDPDTHGYSRDDAPNSVVAVEFIRPASSEWKEASARLEQVKAGVDDDTRSELRRLTDGYLGALAEQRSEGQSKRVSGELAREAETLLSGKRGGMVGVGKHEANPALREAVLAGLVSGDHQSF